MNTDNDLPLSAISVETGLPRIRSLSWGAIFAGTAAGLAVHLLLTMLGIGFGAGALDPVTDENPLGKFGAGTAIAWSVSALVALYVGGWVAGRFTPATVRNTGCVHGFLVWSLATVATFLLISTTAGMAIGGAAKVVGKGLSALGKPVAAAASGVGDVAKNALQQNADQLKSYLDEAVSRIDQARARPEQVIRAKREIGYAMGKVFLPGSEAGSAENRAALVRVLVEQAGLSENDATQLVNDWTASYEKLKVDLKAAKETAEQKAREAADRASKAIAHAAIWTFLAFILGAIAAAFGGKCGARARYDALEIAG